MTRAKLPPQLVLVVVACLLAGVIGFQALAERSRTRLFYDRLQKMDEINKKLKLGLTAAVEKRTKVEGENTKLKSEKEDLQKQLIDLDSSKKSQQDKSKKEIEELQEQVRERKEEVKRLQTELGEVKSKAGSRRQREEKEIVALQEKITALSKENAELRGEIENLKAGAKHVTESVLQNVVGEPEPKVDDGKSETAEKPLTETLQRSTEEKHEASESADNAVSASEQTKKENADVDLKEGRSDLEKDADPKLDDDGAEDEGTNEGEDDDLQAGDEDKQEAQTLEEEKEVAEAGDEDDEEDEKDSETKELSKGSDEEDTELDVQEEGDALENTE